MQYVKLNESNEVLKKSNLDTWCVTNKHSPEPSICKLYVLNIEAERFNNTSYEFNIENEQISINEKFIELGVDDVNIGVVCFGESTNEINLDTDDVDLIDALLHLHRGSLVSIERLIDYYPEVIKSIVEFQAINRSVGYEIDYLQSGLTSVMLNAYFSTMNERRVLQWEKVLNITPLKESTLADRRATINARIRGQGKLNSELISIIVNTFTGGTAKSWITDSVLNVEITPPKANKQFRFENIEQELAKKVPAHLGLNVRRNYSTWGDVKNYSSDFHHVSQNFFRWRDVLYLIDEELLDTSVFLLDEDGTELSTETGDKLYF